MMRPVCADLPDILTPGAVLDPRQLSKVKAIVEAAKVFVSAWDARFKAMAAEGVELPGYVIASCKGRPKLRDGFDVASALGLDESACYDRKLKTFGELETAYAEKEGINQKARAKRELRLRLGDAVEHGPDSYSYKAAQQ